MTEPAYEIIEPDTTQDDGWTILDDKAAEWAINKIREAEQDTIYWQKFYQNQMDKIKARNNGTIEVMKRKLQAYFDTVPKRETKTQAKYPLPSADLVLKNREPKYEHDDDKLLPWLKANEYTESVRTKEEVAWSEAKKHFVLDGSGVVCDKDTGEVCEAVRIIPQDPEFRVVLKEYVED